MTLEACKLSMSDVPSSYEGRLYFILGPGLGDTVNDFRILHEVLLRYPHATAIVYADPRWKSLYRLLPEIHRCVLRYHVAAPSGELVGKKDEPSYSETFRGVMQEIQSEIEEASGFVVLGGFTCLDQLARKELGLATKARAIGLQLPQEQCRPFLPLAALPMSDAQEFLGAQGLQSGQYIAMAPQTWADKSWQASCWQKLTRGLYEKTHLPALVLGTEGYDAWQGPGVYKALGLRLPLVAALIAQARCFVGLDSGLTHVAACFDVPIVGLQAQGKFPPFLVEPHSPLRRIHLTPFVYGYATISAESVQAVVEKAMHSPSSPLCPLCKQVSYVLGARSTQTAYLCRCGLMYRVRSSQGEGLGFSHGKGNESMLPSTLEGLVSLKHRLEKNRNAQSSCRRDASQEYAFEHWISREMSPDDMLSDETEREIWWSWDAVDQMLTEHGLHIVESQGMRGTHDGGAPFSFVVKAGMANRVDHDPMLQAPWGRDLVWLKRSLYARWLRWESFERPNELEDLGWRLVKEGYERDGRDILRFAAKREWRGRTLGRLLRSEWKALESGMKNSQDATAHA